MLSCCVLASTFLFFHLNLNGVICRRHKIGSRMLIHSVCYTFWLGNLTHVHLKQSLIRMDSLPFGFCLSCLFFDCFVSPFVSYCLPLLFVDILQGYTLFCNHFFMGFLVVVIVGCCYIKHRYMNILSVSNIKV